MSDVIRLLPDSVANQIAAGEVIQRPASVIKELVENAVDAGATEIRIYVKDAGRTLIQVVDNGCGMSETDARMAFERHATSKIKKAEDLFTLHSMGFRGEALPSICAVSQVELRTRPHGMAIGTRLLIEGSRVEAQEADVCEPGTSIAVRNIFFNVPARRKFLKSDTVELSNIMREFERLALVNNKIRMSIDTGSRNIDLLGGSFRQRIGDIWKNNLSSQLVPVELDTTLVKISGFVSRPEFARRRNALQFLIVNGRNMRHPYFHKAIFSCFEPLIAADTQPNYFIRFEVDPASIDINIHPTKNEIKFEYETEIWKLLSTAVRSALGMYSAVPSIDFDHDAVPVEPLKEGELPKEPDMTFQQGYNPFDSMPLPQMPSGMPSGIPSGTTAKAASGRGATDFYRRPKTSDWESLYEGFMKTARGENKEGETGPTVPGGKEEAGLWKDGDRDEGAPQALCIQFGLKYIAMPVREGLMLVDQHRAHVKVLFEKYMRRLESREIVPQRVLFPETIMLDAPQRLALEGIREEIEALGYLLEPTDRDEVWQIAGIPPAEREVAEPKDVILRMLESVSDYTLNYGSEALPAETLRQRTALLMARSAAIQGGRRLTGEEMEHLVSELFRLPDPSLTPDGHRIYTLLDLPAITALLP